MPRILVTGSADGIGLMTARLLVKDGHSVVLHARSPQRGQEAMAACPGAEAVLTADMSSIAATKQLAAAANELGHFDAVIHNAGVGLREAARGNTADNLPVVFAVNSLAPYILTCLIRPPSRLVYVSSGLHTSGDASLRDLTWDKKPWDGFQAYSDTKLHNVLLANAVARRWQDKVLSNSVSPGWVATKMGGRGATDSIEAAPETQAWLAVSEDPNARVSGRYWFHKKELSPLAAATDPHVQEEYLGLCARISGVKMPE